MTNPAIAKTIIALLAVLACPAMSRAERPALPAAAAPAVTAPAVTEPSGRYLNALLSTSAPHRQTLEELLRGKQGLPYWVRNISRNQGFVSGLSRQVEIDGGHYEFFAVCAPRSCEVSTFRVLFTLDGKLAFARIGDPQTGEKFLGDPGPQFWAMLRKPGL
jgi:hypothetical protein